MQNMVDSFNGRRLPPYVLAATLFSELNSTKQTALQLSLCSKNAQAITARAGEWGKGFSGITGYIDEAAKEMIILANKIGELAYGMTKASVTSVFESQMQVHLQRLPSERHEQFPVLKDLYNKALAKSVRSQEENAVAIHDLKKHLAEIKSCNRTLNSIIAICRIEASRAGPFQDALWAIADSINHAVVKLSDRISMGDQLMRLMSNYSQ